MFTTDWWLYSYSRMLCHARIKRVRGSWVRMNGLRVVSVWPSLVPKPYTAERLQTVIRQDLGATPRRVPGKKVTRKVLWNIKILLMTNLNGVFCTKILYWRNKSITCWNSKGILYLVRAWYWVPLNHHLTIVAVYRRLTRGLFFQKFPAEDFTDRIKLRKRNLKRKSVIR